MPTTKIEELIIDDTPNLEYSESDDEPIKQAEVEESPILPIPKRQSKKQQECVECPQCNKSMLLKTFKYYHSYKCRPAAPQPTVAKQVAFEKIEVSFNEFQSRKDQQKEHHEKIDI